MISVLFDAAIGMRVRNSLATGDLRAIVQAGLFKQLGTKRGTHYQSAEPLLEIAASVRRNRKTLDASSLFAA